MKDQVLSYRHMCTTVALLAALVLFCFTCLTLHYDVKRKAHGENDDSEEGGAGCDYPGDGRWRMLVATLHQALGSGVPCLNTCLLDLLFLKGTSLK